MSVFPPHEADGLGEVAREGAELIGAAGEVVHGRDLVAGGGGDWFGFAGRRDGTLSGLLEGLGDSAR
jgi:hypothetical protein